MVRGRYANGSHLEPTRTVNTTPRKRLLLFTPPHHIALPALDRGQRAPCHTLAVAQSRWPAIVAAVDSGKVGAALAALEQLAHEMWETTASDPEPWWPTLALARRAVYDNMRKLGVWCDQPTLADAALTRCAVWDTVAVEVLRDSKNDG